MPSEDDAFRDERSHADEDDAVEEIFPTRRTAKNKAGDCPGDHAATPCLRRPRQTRLVDPAPKQANSCCGSQRRLGGWRDYRCSSSNIERREDSSTVIIPTLGPNQSRTPPAFPAQPTRRDGEGSIGGHGL